MSIDISVPGGNPNKPGFSVQRSANGLSISAGALADSPAMFGAMNDEGGLSVSAYPIARAARGLYVSAMMYTTDDGHDIYAPVVVFYDGGGATVAHTTLDSNPANFYPAWFCLGYVLAQVPAGAATFKASFGGNFDAETQFFVSKVRMGLFDGDPVNICPNPDFTVNASDGWTYPDAPGGLSYEATRVTSAPVALPAGESACARMRWRLKGGANPMQSVALSPPL